MASPLPPIPENVEDLVDLPISPDALANAMPSEPVCPKIPGLTFPELPDPAEFGKLIGEKLDSAADAVSESFEDLQEKAKKLEERIKNPPSPTDMMTEMSTQVSSAAEKAAKALEKAAIDLEKQISDNLAAEWDKASEAFTDLESAMEAVRSGAVDLGSLGMDIASLPGDILSGAFAGFKNAAECLKGEPGSAEEAFNAKSEKLSKGVAEGNGLSATAADEEITKQSEETTDENGNKIKKQKTISREDSEKSAAGTTKTAVPQSDSPLATEKDPKSESDSVSEAGVYPHDDNEWYTLENKRKLTPEELDRAYSGLRPKFIKIAARYEDLAEGDTVEIANAKYDESLLRNLERQRIALSGSFRQKHQEKNRLRKVQAYKQRGEAVPAKYLTPIKLTRVAIPHVIWYGQRLVGDGSEALHHPASYNVEFPIPEYDKNATGPILSKNGTLYHWVDGELVKK